jgi:CDP-6-deoxy-D-xylo-4-hexulose-3-dehydrase
MELQGLIGSIQLKYVDVANENRRRSYARVFDSIDSKDLMLPNQYVPAFAIPIICSSSEVRDTYVKKCKELGIETRPIVAGNMNRQPFFKDYVSEIPLPVADKIHTCGFYMPNHPDLTEEEIDYLTSVFTNVSDRSH